MSVSDIVAIKQDGKVSYAKVKYNRPDELVRSMNCAFASWDAAQ